MSRHSVTNKAFYNWLMRQKKRDDPIGDLACDVSRDGGFPQEGTVADIVSHFKARMASRQAHNAFAEAWREFKSKKCVVVSVKRRFEILQRDGFKCQLCGNGVKEGRKLEVDHIKPLSRGGSSHVENLWTLCFECNRGKSNKLIT